MFFVESISDSFASFYGRDSHVYATLTPKPRIIVELWKITKPSAELIDNLSYQWIRSMSSMKVEFVENESDASIKIQVIVIEGNKATPDLERNDKWDRNAIIKHPVLLRQVKG